VSLTASDKTLLLSLGSVTSDATNGAELLALVPQPAQIRVESRPAIQVVWRMVVLRGEVGRQPTARRR
jgi:hypothetical protein